jgi:hypothetical protein
LQSIAIPAPDGYVAANLSICNFKGSFLLAVRAVNYRMSGGYHVKGDDPSYRSRLLVSHLDDDFNVAGTVEVKQPPDLPMLSSEALGLDDPRPFT